MPKRKIFLNSCCISISIFICSFLFLTPYFLQKKIYVFLNIEQLFFLFNIVEPPPISFYFCTIFTYYFVSQIDCPSKKMHDPFFYLFFQRIVRVHSLSCTTSFSSSTIRLFPCIIFCSILGDIPRQARIQFSKEGPRNALMVRFQSKKYAFENQLSFSEGIFLKFINF